ncbi:otopetrin-1 [Crotalus adamanteus]|uniref:Otopetrin-1 n=1 Tax=Crotalus adamanteus TaxID=8729 RepID=A0AAW1BAN9_CROAD
MGLRGSPFESAATDPKICAQTSPTADGWELERAAEEPWPPPIQRAKGGEDRRWPLLAKVGRSCPQKSAETLSSQYGLHLLLAGLLLMFAWAVHAVGVAKSDVLAYLLSLMVLQLLWMAWYLCRRCAHKRLIQEKDTQAGARWLKCGITLAWGSPPQQGPSHSSRRSHGCPPVAGLGLFLPAGQCSDGTGAPKATLCTRGGAGAAAIAAAFWLSAEEPPRVQPGAEVRRAHKRNAWGCVWLWAAAAAMNELLPCSLLFSGCGCMQCTRGSPAAAALSPPHALLHCLRSLPPAEEQQLCWAPGCTMCDRCSFSEKAAKEK